MPIPTNPVLFGEALRSSAVPWLEELGKSDRDRLDALLGLAVRERIRLSDCLKALFPAQETRKAQTAFRKRLNDVSKGGGRADLGLRFHVDTKKQNPPDERVCWFTGPDPAMAQVARYSDQVTADIEGKPLVPAQGLATTGTAMASGRRPVRFFVSYAHADRQYVEALVKELRTQFASSRHYDFSLWTDRDIQVGEHWRESIAKALHACDCGLLLLSPAFLMSSFIGQHELPHFVGPPDNPKLKPVIPVGLMQVSFERQDLKGLERHQVFLGQAERIEGRFYEQLQGGTRKREFVHKLYLAIEKRLDTFFAPPPPSSPPPAPRGLDTRTSDALADHVPMPDELLHFQPSHCSGSMASARPPPCSNSLVTCWRSASPGRSSRSPSTWISAPTSARPGTASLPSSKLLISCRSHYFRDVGSQNSMLVGEDREGLDRNLFPAFCLLPFTEEQIRKYLDSFFGDPESGARAFDFIASIHDLRDLAERPYLLSLISGRIGELEQLQARGEKVNAARLYELVVNSWLNRDDGKHQLEPLHKRRLMEELAVALWREGTREWDVDRLEEWLEGYLAANPILSESYKYKDRAVLKEDLRTATFVPRPTTEEKRFRFAHTSLQEYFLAAYLARALKEKRLERWDLPKVSQETLDFLGQILLNEPQPEAPQLMGEILDGERLDAAVLAFAYWLRALAREYPVPVPKRVKLAGADLEGWHLRGRGPSQPLNLRGADLSRVRLNRARVEHVDLADADLTGLEARQALFLKVSAPRARAQEVDFRGLRWREGSLPGAELRGARLEGCQWIRVGLTGASLPEGWEQHATAVEEHRSGPPPQTGTPRLTTILGHASEVRACAWSPDGQRLLSGSLDKSLKVWDASSGQCAWSGHVFPEGQTASIDEAHGRILHASPEAWRWLGWRWTEPTTGQLRLLPAEAFGPLPA